MWHMCGSKWQIALGQDPGYSKDLWMVDKPMCRGSISLKHPLNAIALVCSLTNCSIFVCLKARKLRLCFNGASFVLCTFTATEQIFFRVWGSIMDPAWLLLKFFAVSLDQLFFSFTPVFLRYFSQLLTFSKYLLKKTRHFRFLAWIALAWPLVKMQHFNESQKSQK